MREDLIITRIRNYVLGLTEISGHPNTDYQHAIHVSENIKILAHIRGLNQEDAQLIAWLHDIGRMKGLDGPHAISGSVEAERLLHQYELDDDKVALVKDAIFNHSTKDQVHDKYSELIKDADSMAHLREEEYLDDYESFRAKWAMEHVELDIGLDMTKVISKLSLELDRGLNKPIDKYSVDGMHRALIDIQTFLWLIEYHSQWDDGLNDIKNKVDILYDLTRVTYDLCKIEHNEEACIELSHQLVDVSILDIKPLLQPLNAIKMDVEYIIDKFMEVLTLDKLHTDKGYLMLDRFYSLHHMGILQSPCMDYLNELIEILEHHHIHDDIQPLEDKTTDGNEEDEDNEKPLKLAIFKVKKMISLF